jgi:hypothetical protein
VSPRAYLLIGVALLASAQALASGVIAGMRQSFTPNREVYEALTPGEFAGTLMLGGFRGLACDLLWMRADSAKEEGRFYESVALFQTISRIQPRFEQIWSYIAYDMAYNLAHEVEDDEGKWAWFLAGVEANVRGYLRNPHSERLLRHLALMFMHKGDRYHARIAAYAWAPMLQELIDEVDRRLPPERRIGALPTGSGLSNFRIAAMLYRACLGFAETTGHTDQSPFVRRMVPLALESDGNLLRNRGRHLEALRVYLESLVAWQEVKAWYASPPPDAEETPMQIEFGMESYERNEGRLRRTAAQLARELAPPDVGGATVDAIMARDFSAARASLARPGWKELATRGRIHWLDE